MLIIRRLNCIDAVSSIVTLNISEHCKKAIVYQVGHYLRLELLPY